MTDSSLCQPWVLYCLLSEGITGSTWVLFADTPFTACTTWNILTAGALGEVCSPCTGDVFAVIRVRGGVAAVGGVAVPEAVLVILGPRSRLAENPSAIPSIQTAARARIHFRIFV